MSGNIIETRGLGKVFQSEGGVVNALKGVDLAIERGETVGVVGVSGSGKSTLLHILGTLDRPTSGEVLFEGTDVFQRSDRELAFFRNRELGFVFQFHYLLGEFNALENVKMPCLISGMEQEQAEEMALDVLRSVGLEHRLSHRPGELSGGEQQRVAIARGCVLKPKVILADEPTGNLDVEAGASIIDLLLKMNADEGITIVMVTHDVSVASRLGRLIRLLDGRTVNDN